MARIDIANIRHAYGRNPKSDTDVALHHVNQAFGDGGLYALLGPPGCGKTTLLNIISGLVTPTLGRVRFNGEDVTDVAASKRNVAHVPETPAVHESRTVRENLAFPLRNRGLKLAEINRRVNEALELTELKGIGDQKARGFAADVRQRIALGRGLVRPDAGGMLLDEPLAAIEPPMKRRMLSRLQEMHKSSGCTLLYATHNQAEALTLASKVVVMHAGQIVQVGSPKDLFERPSHTFVGRFIGSPGMNVIPTSIDGARMRLGEYVAVLPCEPRLRGKPKLEIGVRPESMRLGDTGIPAKIARIEDAGRFRIVRAVVEGHAITVIAEEGEEIPAEPHITFDPAGVHLYADGWRIDLGAKADM
ncbi:MAG: ABC transporter ATP-binding protein [Hyphomonadaceae bacterium]